MTSRGLVLVIDSDAGARENLTAYLSKIGYDPRAAVDDARALELIAGEIWPTVIVRDAADEKAGGDAFVERMRSGPKPPPALLMMVKPFHLVDFGDKLLRLVREHRALGGG